MPLDTRALIANCTCGHGIAHVHIDILVDRLKHLVTVLVRIYLDS